MDNPLNWFAIPLFCLCLGAAVRLAQEPGEPVSNRIPIELPAHPNAGVVDGDCVGQPDGTWKCSPMYHSISKPSPDIWKAIRVCARNEITKEQELVCID